jgi:hypothetical protein
MTSPAGQVHGRVTFTSLPFNIRSSMTLALAEDSRCDIAIVGAQQVVDNGQMSLAAREVQRRPAVIVYRFHVCSVLPQLLDNLNVSIVAGIVKSRVVVVIMILGVHVSSSTQEVTDLWQVVLYSRLEQFFVNTIHYFFRRWTMDSISGCRLMLRVVFQCFFPANTRYRSPSPSVNTSYVLRTEGPQSSFLARRDSALCASLSKVAASRTTSFED